MKNYFNGEDDEGLVFDRSDDDLCMEGRENNSDPEFQPLEFDGEGKNYQKDSKISKRMLSALWVSGSEYCE